MSTASKYDGMWWWLRALAGPLVRVLLRPEVMGRDRLPRSGPVLFVSNHEAWWDIPLIGYAAPRPVRFMAKSELFKNRAIGGFLRKGGAFPVRRDEPDRDVFRTVHDAFTDGDIVAVFLQGHRQAELANAKAGAGRIAIVESAPTVAVAIKGTRGWRPGRRVQIVFGEPRVYEKGERRPGDAYRETADELLEQIRGLREGDL
ncbi:MAG TPA: lysophospholipid acyltransferase family protein [Nakamurella sp.]